MSYHAFYICLPYYCYCLFIMVKTQVTIKKLMIQAEINGYKRGTHRKEDRICNDYKYITNLIISKP